MGICCQKIKRQGVVTPQSIRPDSSNKNIVKPEDVMRMEPNEHNKANLTEAKRLLEIAKRKDYYKLLNVSRSDTGDEIKRAYRKQAILHHPDKHVSESEARQMVEEQLFKEVVEAYSVLSDPNKRAWYNLQVDLQAILVNLEYTSSTLELIQAQTFSIRRMNVLWIFF